MSGPLGHARRGNLAAVEILNVKRIIAPLLHSVKWGSASRRKEVATSPVIPIKTCRREIAMPPLVFTQSAQPGHSY
jgi:hypothetical protein